MPSEPAPAPRTVSRSIWFRNWTSLAGMALMIASLFSFLFLLTLELFSHGNNPYVGVLTYMVAPGFLAMGGVLTVIGALVRRRKLGRESVLAPRLQIDLSRPRDRKLMGMFVAGAVVFLLISALGSYHTYHFTESTAFCGQTCHQVMEPELTAYLNGPHARVPCTECHIGPGATWFVKSKLAGTYQVYAVATHKYPRPISTPIGNLRPAQETCEQCHWPKKFSGNLDRGYNYYLGDQTNSAYFVRLLLKVGGSDPTHGPVGGIHWHMNVGNKVEYYASDHARQTIPWVRVTDAAGKATVYRTSKFTNDPPQEGVRSMDCIDCHNRPAHVYQPPSKAVNLAIRLGRIDPGIPFIKSNAVAVLTRPYEDRATALAQIAAELAKTAPGHPSMPAAIAATQQIYTNNFFPHMRVSWKTYPDNIGHKEWPGCSRCHDDKHKAPDGRKLTFSQCNTCHTILAQGPGTGAATASASLQGQAFQHPGDEIPDGYTCHECHTGSL